jgi:predicted GTPase
MVPGMVMLQNFLRALGIRRDENNAELLTRLKDQPVETIVAELVKRKQELDGATVRLGVIGMTGAGKSSLINAIFGRSVARVGVVSVEHPPDGEAYEIHGFTLVDLPGAGAISRPAATYVADLKLLEPNRYDGFLLVTASRLTEADVALFKEVHVQAGKPFFVVRTHFDLAVHSAGAEALARQQIEEFFRRHLALAGFERVYMVASPQPERYDLPRLLEDIAQALPELKQTRVLEVIPAYTEELLKKKRQAVEDIIFVQASLAAANGLNPIPGIDIAVDVALLQKMTERVITSFGLTRSQLEGLARVSLGSVTLDRLLDIAAPVLGRLATAGVISLFREAGTDVLKSTARHEVAQEGGRYFFKYGVRYAPVIGQLVSAGVGFAAAYLYGKYLLNECEETLRKVLAALPPPQGTQALPP